MQDILKLDSPMRSDSMVRYESTFKKADQIGSGYVQKLGGLVGG